MTRHLHTIQSQWRAIECFPLRCGRDLFALCLGRALAESVIQDSVASLPRTSAVADQDMSPLSMMLQMWSRAAQTIKASFLAGPAGQPYICDALSLTDWVSDWVIELHHWSEWVSEWRGCCCFPIGRCTFEVNRRGQSSLPQSVYKRSVYWFYCRSLWIYRVLRTDSRSSHILGFDLVLYLTQQLSRYTWTCPLT